MSVMRKIIRKILSEQEVIEPELEQPVERKEWEPRWVYEKDYESKKRAYVSDSIENLTGHFGVNPSYNPKRLYNIISNIFDASMKDIYHQGIKVGFNQIESIAKNVAGNDYEEGDAETVFDILNNEFNGE